MGGIKKIDGIITELTKTNLASLPPKKTVHKVKRFFIAGLKLTIVIYALIGFGLTSAFFATRAGLTNVAGVTDPQSTIFNNTAEQLSTFAKSVVAGSAQASDNSQADNTLLIELCQIDKIGQSYPGNAAQILQTYTKQTDLPIITNMIQAVWFRLSSDYQEKLNSCVTNSDRNQTVAALVEKYPDSNANNIFPWPTTIQWQTTAGGLAKDQPVLTDAAIRAGSDPRQVMAICAVEQLRLYFTQRELFERYFKPLKILAAANKNAWGVMSIKETAAKQTEANLKATTSPFYLGSEKQSLLDFSTTKTSSERYQRLTSESNHFYSYLYGSVMIAEISHQWQTAGYPIANRPEIIATIFNIGLNHSEPKASPQVGGSTLKIASTQYTFGSLAYEIYYSGALGQEFPYY